MNSHKDGRSAAKALKKSQKNTKKQQQKGSNNVSCKNARNVSVAAATTPITTANASSQYGVNKITGKTMKTASTINNNNNNTSHNNNVAANALPPPQYEGAPKFERSNSFSIRLGKISKIFNSITGSKENLSKIENEPFKFTRSRSMIMPGRFNRRSLIEPQLEQLSEETERSGDLTSPASPRKNSLNMTQPPWPKSPITVTVTTQTPDCVFEKPTTKDYKTPRRKSSQVMTSTPHEDVAEQCKVSSVPLANGADNAAAYNPQLNFQKRRSSTLIASFKSTLSGLTSGALSGEKKKDKLNPKWSASLQSLQAIDNMVSYDNMSFIDYDKFNGYEKQLEKQLSSLSLSQSMGATALGDSVSLVAPPTPTSQTSLPVACSVPMSSPQTVVRRRKKRSMRSSGGGGSQRSSYTFDTDYEHNLDKPKNVYRYSLDSRKLELLNEVTRSSFIWDKHIVDVLNLEDGSVGRRKTQFLHTRAMDAVDGMQQVSEASNIT